jgi:alcohol dehydrogenase YqhD (iron-dependent ADH family)
MQKFEFYSPVRIIFGAGELERLGTESAKYGQNVLLVKSEGPLEKLGVFKKAEDSLKSAGQKVFSLENVAANPKLSSVYDGIEICRKNNIDLVVAIGGGSAIDCAKGIAVGAMDDGDVWDFYDVKRVPVKALPVGAVSTIAATGAEMSPHSVITNSKTNQKNALHSELNLPKFAIIDPELQKTVPRFLTACGMCDTITHAGENYFAGDPDLVITDYFAAGVIKTVLDNEKILDNLDDLAARSELAWAATMGINGITDLGRGAFEYGAHIIEHSISAHFDVIHGAGLSVVHPAWLNYRLDNDESSVRFVKFARDVMGLHRGTMSDVDYGRAGIDALKARYTSWGLPISLGDINVGTKDFDAIAETVVNDPDTFMFDKELVFNVLNRCK